MNSYERPDRSLPTAVGRRIGRRSRWGIITGLGCAAALLGSVVTAGAGVPTSTGSISIDNGQIAIPSSDVGKVNLGALPLGDQQFSSSPAKGKLNLCNSGQLQPANDNTTLPWIHGTTWALTQKVFVSGSVSWPDATFQDRVQGATRTLTGNDLPVGETTGTFPVTSTDPSARYRPDPSRITAHTYSLALPASPKAASSPSCIGGEVGVTVDGVALFDGFDANGRDAAAQEVQDSCLGHPNQAGYHRHAMPLCLLARDSGTGHSRLLGYALDGFGIYGPRGDHGKVLTTSDLDACHGTTDTITWNGKKVRMYHYVLTWQFPYSVGCFRGTPVSRSIFGAGPMGMGPGGSPPATP